MASSTEDKVKQIIVEQLGVDETEVTPRLRSSTTSARTRSTRWNW